VPTVWRLSDPAVFARLRSARRRARSGALWLTWVPPVDPTIPPRVAFAIGRKVGGAVVRNRLRRRLRSALSTRTLVPGDYLVGVAPGGGDLGWDELNVLVDDLLASLPATSAPSAEAGVGAST